MQVFQVSRLTQVQSLYLQKSGFDAAAQPPLPIDSAQGHSHHYAETPPKNKHLLLHDFQHSMSKTAYELIHSLPSRLKTEKAKAGGHAARVHFLFSGDGACELTVVMADGICTVTDGREGTPDCVVRAKAKDYADLELGRIDAKMAFLFGKVKVSRPGMMMTFINLFQRATE